MESSGERAKPPPRAEAVENVLKDASERASSPLDGSTELARPLPPPSYLERQRFEQIASNSLGTTSDGLVALLRDHPELVSSELAKDARERLPDIAQGTQQLDIQSYPGTPHEPDNLPSTLFPASSAPMRPSLMVENRRSSGTIALANKDVPLQTRGGQPTSRPAMWYPTGVNMASLTGSGTPNLGKTSAKPDYSEEKIVVCMVGLPARGKSYLSNKLMRYLKVSGGTHAR